MINLLPAHYKQELEQEENFRLVLILGTVFMIFLASLILILLSVKVYIKGSTDSLALAASAEKEKLQTIEFQETRQRIVQGNKKILEMKSFYEKQSNPAAIFEKISQTLPSGVFLTSLSWQKGAGVVIISGFAPSREVLFALRSNLESQEQFSQVYFPPQNWIKAKDIDFQATFELEL